MDDDVFSPKNLQCVLEKSIKLKKFQTFQVVPRDDMSIQNKSPIILLFKTNFINYQLPNTN